MTPDLRQLRYFVAVAQERGFTAAAQRLHISQQSLSQQIATVERMLGAPLFQRGPRGVTLTTAGEALLPGARAALAQAERAWVTAQRAARGETGELRVGFLSSVANYLMPAVVRGMAQRAPGVALRAEELSIARLVAGVREGTLDAGLSRPPLVDDLQTAEILREPVAAVLPEGHPLSQRARLALADLADEPWVLTERSAWPPWHEQYDRDFARAGFAPRVVQRGTSPQNLLALVAAGVGVTRLPLSSRSLRDGGVSFVALDDDDVSVVLVWREPVANPALPALREVLADVGATLDPVNSPAGRAAVA